MVLKRIWEARAVSMENGSVCSKEEPYIPASGMIVTEPLELKARLYRLVLYGEDLSGVSVSSECFR